MNELNTKLTNFIKSKRVNKWWKLALILSALTAYFIAALDFQLIAHDDLSSTNLTLGTTFGFLGATLLGVTIFLYSFVDTKYGSDKSVMLIYLAFIALVITLLAIIFGSIGYLEFR